MRMLYNYLQVKELEDEILQMQNFSESELRAQKSNAFCMQFKKDFFGRQRVVLFAGPNENGALGLRIATTLASLGHDIMVVLLNPTGVLPELVIKERDNFLESYEDYLMEVTSQFSPPPIHEEDILIDAICGVEQQTPLKGSTPNVIMYLNSLHATKISIDIPSGLLEGDNSENDSSKIFKANLTYTYYGPKLSFLFRENHSIVGSWSVMNLGINPPSDVLESDFKLFDTYEMEHALPRRGTFTHKYDYGKVLLIGGSRGMIGAPILAGRAAMTSGVGHLTLHLPKGYETVAHVSLPEALVSIDFSSDSFSADSLKLEDYDTVAVGPGLGQSTESRFALEYLMQNFRRPMILDADALNIIANAEEDLLALVPEGSILTPHEGEFDRLFGASSNSYSRLMKAIEMAKLHKMNILLKGAYSATCSADGLVYFNTSGNPGLATAGTGDVLVGIILALLGKGHTAVHSCCVAAYLHGFAADLYASAFCQESLTASKLIEQLPIAFKRFKNDREPPSMY